MAKIWDALKKAGPDVGVVVLTLLLIYSILISSYVVLGSINLIIGPPALSQTPAGLLLQQKGLDSDNDMLPDIIEMAPKGQPVYDSTYGPGILGYGTGTDPFKKDTDGDLLSDAAENKLGSDPRNFFDPGWIWIALLLTALAAVSYKYVYKPDPLREYKMNESHIAKSTASGKYAYGKRDLTDEERAKLIEQDARFQMLTAYSTDDVQLRKKKKNYAKIALQTTIAVFIGWLIFYGATA